MKLDLDRETLLSFERPRAERASTAGYELRDTTDPDTVRFEGYACVTDVEYPIAGGVWPGWIEMVASGAFRKTLRERADVAFLVNHTGMSLARTKSGTLRLEERTDGTPTGLWVSADLDRRMQPVADLLVASARGDIDEMSFAFRVIKDDWYDDTGRPSDAVEGTRRVIREVSLAQGDVSVVNYGANPATAGAGFRALEQALAELRSGRIPSTDLLADLRELLAPVVDAPVVDAPDGGAAAQPAAAPSEPDPSGTSDGLPFEAAHVRAVRFRHHGRALALR